MGKITMTKIERMIIVESAIKPSSEQDLSRMAAGDLARVTHKKPFRNWEIYEGVINGEYAFMMQDPQELMNINSFRISPKEIKFDNRFGALLPKNKTRKTVYSPKNPEYEIKKQMLIKQGHWAEID